MAEFLRSLSPRVLARLRLGLRAFEWLPFPWRFSRLDQEAAEDFLRKLDSSRFPLHHDLLLMAKLFSTLGYAVAPEVEARVGVRTDCALADGTLPEPAGSLGDTQADGEGEECEVAIVGSGAGGAVAAAMLAEAGLDVLVLEAGAHYTRDDYPAGRLEAITELYREAGLTIAEGRPPIPVPVAKVVGGTTVINSGTCFRAPDGILAGWRDEFGIPWATDLDADFAEAEEFLRVTPLDPNRMGRNGQLAMEGAAALGVSGGPIARNAGNCTQCSSCPYGCAIDAKRGMHVSYLPRAVAAGARIRAGVEAQRVVVEDGRAVGLACSARDAAGRDRPFTVRASRAVIAAGGAFGTPELLLRSGLGGRQVGRNLRIHPACWVGARYEEDVHGWEGVMQSYYVDQWEHTHGVLLEATFTPLAFGGAWLVGTGREHQRSILDFGRIGSIGVQLRDVSVGAVGLANEGALRASYHLNGEDVHKTIFGIARAAEVHFAAGATEVYPNIPRVGVLKPGDLAQFEATRFKASELRLEAFHPMGTARISADPRRGVCAPDGSVNGTRGLYVADASLFPTAPGVNPMMTIVAFAKQVSREVAGGDSPSSPVGAAAVGSAA
ncbi:MAG TPA: GMC family oxidoreductase N-terminal domain-containing protein [Solirubrobacterales bacterium]|nr:GMC family oxidoreductase N-terminal domain-containing protein [Solirubrobacterales bacterium]